MILRTVLIVLSCITFSFLVYTLTHLDQLQISLTQRQVFIEVRIFLVILLIGVKVRLVE